MTDPNYNASAQSVADGIAGTDGNGNQLPWRKVAMFYDSNLFGLSKDYAFPEGSNVSSSEFDQVASETKLLTRTRKMADKNDYDLHDAVFTCLKWVLAQDPTINNDEKNSVNYVAPTA